jgi:phosphoribosyl 1,2-cyclic phosphate phosphodiesterase
MSIVATILGCGSSGGVPRVGFGWGACDPDEPRNRRRRCSLLIERVEESGRTTALIDTGPDLREQLLSADVAWIDGVVYTHEHADHTHGIDDLRVLAIFKRRLVDVHADVHTATMLRSRFAYCFETPPGSLYPPILTLHQLQPGVPIVIGGAGGPIELLPFRQQHGEIDSLGFRVGDLAYSSDINGLPEDSLPFVEGLGTWIVDALRAAPHPSHWSVEESVEWIRRMAPARGILTNMHTDLDYRLLADQLPDGIEPAFDGMRIEVR